MSLTRVDLPEPDTPVTATRLPSGNDDVDPVQVVLAGADDGDLAALLLRAALGRRRDLEPTGEVLAGDRVGVLEQPLHGTGVHDLATVLAGARADVDHPVGRGDGVLVVLDDDEGVAEVAQPRQRLDEPVVVALVQPDARLVEDVEDAHQAGPDLGGQPDALGLTAGQGAGRAVEREVVEADVEQEAQSGVDLLDHPLGDLALAGGEVDLLEELRAVGDGQRTDRRDALATDVRPRATRA